MTLPSMRPKIVTITPNPAIDIATSVPMVAPLQKLRCTAARRDPGGGGINVARVVQRLGGNAIAIYPAGGFDRSPAAAPCGW
jgi:6-phosphofructokinase 2